MAINYSYKTYIQLNDMLAMKMGSFLCCSDMISGYNKESGVTKHTN